MFTQLNRIKIKTAPNQKFISMEISETYYVYGTIDSEASTINLILDVCFFIVKAI